jgi:hypothetical protein
MRGWAGLMVWALLAGCQSIAPPASDPLAAEKQEPADPLDRRIVAAVQSYYPNAEFNPTEEITMWLTRIAPGSRIQKVPPSSLGFIRGLSPERSVDPIERRSAVILSLKISFWGRRTVAEAHRQIAPEKERLEQPGGGLILDLRGNLGGQIDAALEMANRFLPAGKSVAALHSVGGEALYQTSSPEPYRFPVVLLVDRQTASSAELFSGILQQQRRAFVIGTPTAGKESIQSAIPLDPEHLLLLTTGHFELPNRPRLGGSGLSPDESIQENDDAKERAEAFLKQLQGWTFPDR